VVKFQSAFFELLGPAGMQVMQALIQVARQQGWITIWDAKRGDVASTASAYAAAALTGCTLDQQTIPVWDVDALTVNPYLGSDALEPFLEAAQRAGRGVFVLVRTSNPGAGLFQDLSCDGRPLYSHVAEMVARWNAPTVSASGFGDVGAVVGATHPRQLAELRIAHPHLWFLVPGYGAQGGTAEDIRQAAFRSDGLGAIVNSSRGVVFPFHPHDPDWERAIRLAAERAQKELTSR
jgi:orotidine-5'-phosphate decarboxylase